MATMPLQTRATRRRTRLPTCAVRNKTPNSLHVLRGPQTQIVMYKNCSLFLVLPQPPKFFAIHQCSTPIPVATVTKLLLSTSLFEIVPPIRTRSYNGSPRRRYEERTCSTGFHCCCSSRSCHLSLDKVMTLLTLCQNLPTPQSSTSFPQSGNPAA